MTKIKALATEYKASVSIDFVTTVGRSDAESVVIYSTIEQLFDDEALIAVESGEASEDEIRLMTEASVVSFCSFIKALNDIVKANSENTT